MRQGKYSFRHESLQDRKSIRDLLKSVINGIDKGKITFSDEDGEIVMTPKDLLHLKLTATQDENRRRINIRISWQQDSKKVSKKKNISVSSK